jgi:hypothetical protein
MEQPLTEREGFISAFNSLVRVAELPKGPRGVCEAYYLRQVATAPIRRRRLKLPAGKPNKI